jgi:aryl-alcohol dehydrogenase-like predicted oxidoreductase
MSRERIAAMDPTDWRKTNPDFTEPNITRNLALQKLLAEIATQYDATAGEVAIAWTLINPAVTGAIVGMRKPGQIDGVIRAGELKLSDADIQRMESFLNSR